MKKKFRYYHKPINDFVFFEDGNYFYSLGNVDYPNPSLVFNWDTAEQWTGMQDSDRIDIYENDILKHTYSNLINWLISFKEGTFGIYNIGNDVFFPITSGSFLFDRKVIGNIHQNPELIKDQ